ncbi:MAG TPA: glycoside hydrolase family 130 protein [Puia sp.]|nr:glycoside hydrolase family 130 protein [Puia sp.]
MKINKHPIKLFASAKAVITLFLHLPGEDRARHIVERMENLDEEETNECMVKVMHDFANRHRNIHGIFLRHFQRLVNVYPRGLSHFSLQKKLLLGAFLTKEYSIQSAALFNPSIVSHPHQQGLTPGQQRFVMSLRSTGEGHISSIVFHTGIIDEDGDITLDMPTGYFTPLQKKADAVYDKIFIHACAANTPGFNKQALDVLPGSFTAEQAKNIFTQMANPVGSMTDSMAGVEEILDANYELEDPPDLSISERVIFPHAKEEIMGMEDVRFVKFEDDGRSYYYGTYTAYNGKQIKTHLIETGDFKKFTIRRLYGSAIKDKGMALFPEKVNGKFVMVSRQGGENISIMFSDDLYCWNECQMLMEPKFNWEFVQIGNCGSPLKTDMGWLLLTHGVGLMRTYVISAVLLDLDDPTKIIGRLDKPLIAADEEEREGYVPNVVYTCGLIRHGNLLVIPYAVSDSATGFATIALHDLLNEFKL